MSRKKKDKEYTINIEGEQGEKKKKKGIIGIIILIAALIVFIYSAVQLFLIYKEYKKGTDEYGQVLEDATKFNMKDKEEFSVDFEKLMKTNDDTVAWIRFIEPEIISYPVVKGDDNDYYLTHMFDKKTNKSGAIFMDHLNKSDFTDDNTFLYGHNMKNGSMFGRLRKYKEKDYWKENPYFYVYLSNGKVYKYHIFAAYVTDASSDVYTISFGEEKDFEKYLDNMANKSIYKTDVKVTSKDNIVSLSTCTNVTEEERLVIQGVKIEETKMKGGTTAEAKK